MMLFNMFSLNKKYDKEYLLFVISLIETLVKVGTTQALDLAERFGDDYLELEKKINNHDYTPEDIIENRINNYLK